MAEKSDFDQVFVRLTALMKPLEAGLEVKLDAPGNYSLCTGAKRADGYAEWFGSVQVKKNYVSYHLMPVYAHPELLEGISPELKKRMQGKSCFNFKTVDEKVFEELGELTRRGLVKVQVAGSSG